MEEHSSILLLALHTSYCLFLGFQHIKMSSLGTSDCDEWGKHLLGKKADYCKRNSTVVCSWLSLNLLKIDNKWRVKLKHLHLVTFSDI